MTWFLISNVLKLFLKTSQLSLLCYRQYQCPRLPPNQRPPKKKGLKPGRKKLGGQSSDDSSGKKLMQNGDSRLSSSDSDSDEESTFEPFLTLNKPRGLIDGLTRFFTPSDKRKSRVSLSSNAAFIKIKSPKKSKVQTKTHSQSRQAASRLIRKSKILQVNRKRRKSVDGPPGSGQLKGLFDGLSHIFTAQGERKRSLPVYSNSRKRKSNNMEHKSSDQTTKSACDNTSFNGSLSKCIKLDDNVTLTDTKKGKFIHISTSQSSVKRKMIHATRGRGRGRGLLSRSDSPIPSLGLKLLEDSLTDNELSDTMSLTSIETGSPLPPTSKEKGKVLKKGKPSLTVEDASGAVVGLFACMSLFALSSSHHLSLLVADQSPCAVPALCHNCINGSFVHKFLQLSLTVIKRIENLTLKFHIGTVYKQEIRYRNERSPGVDA